MAYDIIIVGARCAGSPLAMLLARKGYRVLLVDKTSFPSDTISTNYIQQPGVAKLKSWNLLDRVRASNCPPILNCTLDIGPFTLAGSSPPADGVAEAYCTRAWCLTRFWSTPQLKLARNSRRVPGSGTCYRRGCCRWNTRSRRWRVKVNRNRKGAYRRRC